MENHAQAIDNSIDPERIAAIVRKVVARLTEPNRGTEPNQGKGITGVVSVKTIEQHTGKRLVITKSAVITPAARDEARRRGIPIERTNETRVSAAHEATDAITDIDNPQRAETIRQQLRRRGIELSTSYVVLSDSPAREVYRQISNGQSAAMVTELADVERFHHELAPTVWVFDMKRLNVPAAVNAAAKISQLANRSKPEETKP